MFSCLKFNLQGESEQFRPNCFGTTFLGKPASQTSISLNNEGKQSKANVLNFPNFFYSLPHIKKPNKVEGRPSQIEIGQD